MSNTYPFPNTYPAECQPHFDGSKPWFACTKCAGEGTWTNPNNPQDVRTCFTCAGTKDGRVKMPFQRPWSPRGPRVNRQPVVAQPAPQPEESHTLSEILQDAPQPIAPQPVNDAAGKLAALLAEILAGKTPVDADSVRDIVREEIENARLPVPLEIVRDGVTIGELPATRHAQCEKLMLAIGQGLHVFIVGPAGSGKTTAAEQVFKALGINFYIQGAIADCSELVGFVDGHGNYHTTAFREAFEHGGGILLDEFDGSIDPGSPLKINSATANDYMQFPDRAEPVRRHPDFVCIAAANTYGTGATEKYIGRTQLDAATLDRFFYLDWEYDPKLEAALGNNVEWLDFVQRARKAVEKCGIETVVSPRAYQRGCTLLKAGMAREDVEKGCIWRGMSKEDVARCKAAM